MASLNLSLTMLTGEHAPKGPGWYVSAWSSDDLGVGKPIHVRQGHLFPIKQTDSSAAKVIAQSFENAQIGLDLTRLVDLGNEVIREAVISELTFAELQATRIAGLRAQLRELEEPSADQS